MVNGDTRVFDGLVRERPGFGVVNFFLKRLVCIFFLPSFFVIVSVFRTVPHPLL